MSISGLSYGVVRVEEQGNITSLTLQDVGLVMPGGTSVGIQYHLYIIIEVTLNTMYMYIVNSRMMLIKKDLRSSLDFFPPHHGVMLIGRAVYSFSLKRPRNYPV